MNSFKGLIDRVRKKILDHVVELLITAVFSAGFYYYWNSLIQLSKYRFSILQLAIFFIIFFVFLFGYNYYKKKQTQIYSKYGLEWRTHIEKGKISIDGPFCPKCLSEIDSLSSIYCSICDKIYPLPNKVHRWDLKQNVKKIIEAELRGVDMLEIDWFIYSYPSSYFSIKNNGVSAIKDILIQINLEQGKRKKVVDKYNIEKIEPDEKKSIDPMNQVNTILEGFGVIKVLHPFVDEGEPDRLEIQKEFSCNLEAIIEYSLKGKKMSQQRKFHMDFKFKTQEEEPINPFEDNCNISITSVN